MSANDFPLNPAEDPSVDYPREPETRLEALLAQWREARAEQGADPEQQERNAEYGGIMYPPTIPEPSPELSYPAVKDFLAESDHWDTDDDGNFSSPAAQAALAALGYSPASPEGQYQLSELLGEILEDRDEYPFLHEDGPGTALAWQHSFTAANAMRFSDFAERAEFAAAAAAELLAERVTYDPAGSETPGQAEGFQHNYAELERLLAFHLGHYSPNPEAGRDDWIPELIVALNHYEDPVCRDFLEPLLAEAIDYGPDWNLHTESPEPGAEFDPADYHHPQISIDVRHSLPAAAKFVREAGASFGFTPEDPTLAGQMQRYNESAPLVAGWMGIKESLLNRGYVDQEQYENFVTELLGAAYEDPTKYVFPNSPIALNKARIEAATQDYLLAPAPAGPPSGQERELLRRMDGIEQSMFLNPGVETGYRELKILHDRRLTTAALQEALLTVSLTTFRDNLTTLGYDPATAINLEWQEKEVQGETLRFRYPELNAAHNEARHEDPALQDILRNVQNQYRFGLLAMLHEDPEKYKTSHETARENSRILLENNGLEPPTPQQENKARRLALYAAAAEDRRRAAMLMEEAAKNPPPPRSRTWPAAPNRQLSAAEIRRAIQEHEPDALT